MVSNLRDRDIVARVVAVALIGWASVILAYALVVSCLGGCQTPAILTPTTGPNECRNNEVACVGENLKPTGFCCPESEACGGPWPNVGCPAGECCPTESAEVEGRKRTKQRRAAAGESK